MMLQEPSLVSGFASIYIMSNFAICDSIQDLFFNYFVNSRLDRAPEEIRN